MLHRLTKILPLLLIIIGSLSHPTSAQRALPTPFSYDHPIPFKPKTYVCHKTRSPITIDGKATNTEWNNIPWTNFFVDIQGELKPTPAWNTRAKMTWDDDYFYFLAVMKEPHIWATLTERDAIIYHDDDFEIFIDPDGDGHNYFEFEMNALNTIWDLYMLYPYGIDDGRNYIMNWDIKGVKTAVHVDGTINDPSDVDRQWSVEVAVPWETFQDFYKGSGKPVDGEQWRVNFSRVDWQMTTKNEKYEKVKDASGKNMPENNWVWSPTGFVNMHKPETWGYVQFATNPNTTFRHNPNEDIKWALWQLYYQLKECYQIYRLDCANAQYEFPEVAIPGYSFKPEIRVHPDGFSIIAASTEGEYFIINHRGKIIKYSNK